MSDKNRVCGIVSIILASLNGLGLIGFTIGMLYQRPRFEAIYADLGLALPVATQLLISTPGVVFLLVALVLLSVLVVKELMPRKAIALVLNIVWLVVGIIVSLLCAMALIAPMAAAIEQM